ncbi:MAG TPA: SCO family protein [Rhizomicrobium sp.]|jgi:protein SCO1/2
MKRAVFLALLLLTACGRGELRPGVSDISGIMPDLHFAMTRANDGTGVTAADYRGKPVALYFGYTNCPDECPATLANLSLALHALGSRAKDVRVLFVTVDPTRDTIPKLKSYVNAFAPEIDGLRGSPDAIAKFARDYRVLYSVTETPKGEEVMHSDAVFLFDADGHAREAMLDTNDVKAITADIETMLR